MENGESVAFLVELENKLEQGNVILLLQATAANFALVIPDKQENVIRRDAAKTFGQKRNAKGIRTNVKEINLYGKTAKRHANDAVNESQILRSDSNSNFSFYMSSYQIPLCYWLEIFR